MYHVSCERSGLSLSVANEVAGVHLFLSPVNQHSVFPSSILCCIHIAPFFNTCYTTKLSQWQYVSSLVSGNRESCLCLSESVTSLVYLCWSRFSTFPLPVHRAPRVKEITIRGRHRFQLGVASMPSHMGNCCGIFVAAGSILLRLRRVVVQPSHLRWRHSYKALCRLIRLPAWFCPLYTLMDRQNLVHGLTRRRTGTR